MTLSNQPAYSFLRLQQNRPFGFDAAIVKQDGSPVDLTGAVVTFTMGALNRVATMTDPTLGIARIVVQGDELTSAGKDTALLWLKTSEDYTVDLVSFELEIAKSPDSVVPADSNPVVPAEGLTIRLLDQNRVTVKVNHHPDSALLALEAQAETHASAAGISAEQAAASAAAADVSAADVIAEIASATDAAVGEATGIATAAAATASAAATTATTRATEALGYRNVAQGYASTAGTAAGTAGTKADEAVVSAGQAAASATAAQGFATAASGSAGTATTKAGEASTSAGQASTSAGQAATSAADAAASATSAGGAAAAAVSAHAGNTNNPHAVTKTQVGLGNVDNTADASKPISTAMQAALDLKAPLAGPAFTGNPTATTQAGTDNSTRLATTAFVKGLAYAPLASPALTGTPTAPTAATATNTTQVATTAYVKAQGYATLASPVFADPTSNTQPDYDNSGRLATTAFTLANTSPAMSASSELRESFASMGNGAAPNTSKTRQTMTNFQFYAGSTPTIRSGFLSTLTPSSAQAGSYRIAQLADNVLRVGARFAFTPYTNAGGLLCLSIQATSISAKTEGQVPVAPMHFQISPTGWSLDVNAVDNAAVVTVASGTFDTALTADSVTLHSVEIVLDRDRQQCYVTFPDGQTMVFTDSRFALAGAFVYVEPFKTAGSLSTKTDALVREWWADSRVVEALPQIRREAVTPWVAPTFSNSWVNAGGTNQVMQYRKQGDRVKLRGMIKTGALGTVAFTLPAGFRPKSSRQFGTVANNGTNSIFGAFYVQSDGAVVPYVGANTFISIECEFETS